MKMEQNNTKNNTNHLLTSGAPAHTFSKKEQSKGGKATKFGALKHGRYAVKPKK